MVRVQHFDTLRQHRKELLMTVMVTPRPPIDAASHIYTIPVVRELPPVLRPGTFDNTW